MVDGCKIKCFSPKPAKTLYIHTYMHKREKSLRGLKKINDRRLGHFPTTVDKL